MAKAVIYISNILMMVAKHSLMEMEKYLVGGWEFL
nr:MAG: hypothetical protein [Bacteriophage sp.]